MSEQTETKIKILTINLTTEKVEVLYRQDLVSYLGGIGVASKLFSEMVQPELKPLAPEQPLILANGPMSTIFPVVTKVVAVFRSPLTGDWGESHAGMRLALSMRQSGYNAIVIHGRAKKPVYLSISQQGVKFKNATALWGLNVGESGSILRRLEPDRSHRSCIRIGPSGEKQVAFANVNVDTYRHFGRLGMGAVMGSKNLKAVVIHGQKNEPIANYKKYNQVYSEIFQRVVNTDIMKKYHQLGTSININALNNLGGLPTKNLQAGQFEHAMNISGEAFAEESLIRKMACSGCPVGCIHIGLRRREYAPGYEYESKALSYDYELIFALGSFLGMSSQEKVYDLIDLVEELGLDAMSAGVALGWVTEAFANHLIDETTLETKVAFDYLPGYLKVLENLVRQPNEFYQTLAQGTEVAAHKYGGLDYAMTLSKTEMAGYHTGHSNVLGLATGARHSHLDNAGYSMDQKNREQKDPEKMVEDLIAEEKWRNVLNCLCICLFARQVYTPETVIAALDSIGINRSAAELNQLGENIFLLKHQVRTRLGFDLDKMRIPSRFFETPSLTGKVSHAILNQMISFYKAHLKSLESNISPLQEETKNE